MAVSETYRFSLIVLITSVLGVRSHLRFKRILNISRNMKHGSAIAEKLAYFKDMNIYMTVVLFFYGSSLAILCVDGMTTEMLINSNKFASDLLIANCDTASAMIWIVGVTYNIIKYPKIPVSHLLYRSLFSTLVVLMQ